ncbi:indole-3-glycerol phosphate synthase TrpC [Robertkochia marina]|uniref:Indole-3-glycerol phosphate synthase n=1 Tax=Robertkochia marina TaxID=1227945 RepID=A0A4V3UXY6_9FLAO|nr:indole-3-glycerol phosphate synthase TrpC [Robertkochia marina]THD66394.1 indole-3-glycerol phosphate synthase TrpC [Robertkochia marina]TRZ44073.1 indole-3-glycerol phosphate synthase TrpC [Robertkochia marina]
MKSANTPSILSKIIYDKQVEVALKKQLISESELRAAAMFKRSGISLSARLRNSDTGIIAEHKRRSPSKAVINQSLSLSEVAKGYEKAGACGMSVLTEGKYFGGSLEDLQLARASVNLPLLRKDFISDPYQLLEAKAHGADVILLIAAALSPGHTKELALQANDLGLEVLLEVHTAAELDSHLNDYCHMVGVNNRNLKTFEVSVETSKSLAEVIPDSFVKVSESGISDEKTITALRPYGFRGFLVGEHFMRTEDPGQTARQFINSLKQTAL